MNRSKDRRPSLGPNSKPDRLHPPFYRRAPFRWSIMAVLVVAEILMFKAMFTDSGGIEKITWSEFVDDVNKDRIASVEIGNAKITGEFREEHVKEQNNKTEKGFVVVYMSALHTSFAELEKTMEANGVEIVCTRPRIWPFLLLQYLLPLLIFGALIYLLIHNVRSGLRGITTTFGRSKHKLHHKDRVQITFEDVAGVEEAKDEVTETIEFLKNPKRFQRLGGRIPRGVLLAGPPGCGKTLLAKAIAGEANVPFFNISGSDFVEMFVGVGASRVRDLFKQAKDSSPCIIFLDEIDAIGRKRSGGVVASGNDERERTLNAILVEMDGFDTNDQVIVIAATNRADILDNALTRPGRFDRQIFVPLPDLKGRVDILNVHIKKIELGPDVDLERVARGTPMFSGADLAAIVNEAALAATLANKDFVEMADLEEARDKVKWGRARRSRVIDEKEKEITAYHEAGHTLVRSLLEDADPLHKVSIIPRGPMGGATFALPEKDRTLFTRRYCVALMQVCFGGRVAEEMFFDDITSGAQSDILQATRMARQMVITWGMSSALGPISYGSETGIGEQSNVPGHEKKYSEKTAEAIDAEVKTLTDDAYSRARELIEANKDKLESIAKALLEYETLDADDVQVILDGGELDKPAVFGFDHTG